MNEHPYTKEDGTNIKSAIQNGAKESFRYCWLEDGCNFGLMAKDTRGLSAKANAIANENGK